MSEFERPMRVKEFSEKYKIHPNVLYNHIKDGTLPAHRIAGVTMIFESEVLESSRIGRGDNDAEKVD